MNSFSKTWQQQQQWKKQTKSTILQITHETLSFDFGDKIIFGFCFHSY